MQTPKGVQVEQMVDELTCAFKNYLHSLFDEWKRSEPKQIQQKVECPLFTINDDKTIVLNFAKEVIMLYFKLFIYILNCFIYLKLDASIKESRYILFGQYNYKNPIFPIGIEDIPSNAIRLYKRENRILEYKRDIEEIVKWFVNIYDFELYIYIQYL